RSIDVVLQCRVFGARDSATEQVGVETRAARHREHVPVVWVDGDEGPASASECFLSGALHLQIQRKNDVFARGRSVRVQVRYECALFVYRAALGVDQNFTRAVDTMELRFVRALDALLAYQRRAGIGSSIDVGQVRFADRAHIAQRMYTKIAVGIGAGLPCLDVQALELEAPHRK